MIKHERSSITKALLYVAGVLGFFLIVMHQASQFFR